MPAEPINQLLREHDGIKTLGQLRALLADLPDDTPVHDCMEEPLCISVFPEPQSPGVCAIIK